MAGAEVEQTGIIEEDAEPLISTVWEGAPLQKEKAAKILKDYAKQGKHEREFLLRRGAVPALCSMCTRDHDAKTNTSGALSLAALCSNYSQVLDESRIYSYPDAQLAAAQCGIVSLLVPILTSWQPDSQAASATALADICFRNSDLRKAMLSSDACRALVNLVHSENHEVHKAALVSLRALAVESRYGQEIEARGGLQQGVRWLQVHINDNKPEIVARALAFLWTLGISDSVKLKLAKEKEGEIMRQVQSCVRSSPDHAVIHWAVAVLRQFCMMPEEIRAELFGNGVHMDLITMLKSKEEATLLNSLGGLQALCMNEQRRTAIKLSGEVGELVEKLCHPPKGQKAVAKRAALIQRAVQLKQLLDS